MDKDQVQGTLKEAAGKVQQTTGKVIGSTEQQVKCLRKQSDGRQQKSEGDTKGALKQSVRKSAPPPRHEPAGPGSAWRPRAGERSRPWPGRVGCHPPPRIPAP
jgi:uncharacterized protein YjbJ (UPF0337 family)